jgi:hypothetical protein
LPDGLFSNQNPNLGKFWREDVGIFYGQLVHFTVFCYILWTFGKVRGNLVYFTRFGILYLEKSGNPADDDHLTEWYPASLARWNITSILGAICKKNYVCWQKIGT